MKRMCSSGPAVSLLALLSSRLEVQRATEIRTVACVCSSSMALQTDTTVASLRVVSHDELPGTGVAVRAVVRDGYIAPHGVPKTSAAQPVSQMYHATVSENVIAFGFSITHQTALKFPDRAVPMYWYLILQRTSYPIVATVHCRPSFLR